MNPVNDQKPLFTFRSILFVPPNKDNLSFAFGRIPRDAHLQQPSWMKFTHVAHAFHCDQVLVCGICKEDGTFELIAKDHKDYIGPRLVWFGAVPCADQAGEGPVFDTNENRYGPVLLKVPFEDLLSEFAHAHRTKREKLVFTLLGERRYKRERSHTVLVSSPDHQVASILGNEAKLSVFNGTSEIVKFDNHEWFFDVRNRSADCFDHPEFVFFVSNVERLKAVFLNEPDEDSKKEAIDTFTNACANLVCPQHERLDDSVKKFAKACDDLIVNDLYQANFDYAERKFALPKSTELCFVNHQKYCVPKKVSLSRSEKCCMDAATAKATFERLNPVAYKKWQERRPSENDCVGERNPKKTKQ